MTREVDRIEMLRRLHRENNPRHQTNARQNNKRYKVRIEQLKEDEVCERCGEDEAVCLDFYPHDETQRSFSISNLLSQGFDWTRIVKELGQCRVLCKNCHAKEQAGI